MAIRIRPETLVIVAFVVSLIAGALLLIGLKGIGTLFIAAGLGCLIWFFASLALPALLWPFGDNTLAWPRWMLAVTAFGVALIVIGYVLIRLGAGFERHDIEIPTQ